MKLSFFLFLFALIVFLTFYGSEAGRRNRNRKRLTCSNIQAREICTAGRAKFMFFNGCVKCHCQEAIGIARCPEEENRSPCPVPASESDELICAKNLRKINRMISRARTWDIKCLKSNKVCRKHLGATFFDGCQECRCPSKPGEVMECRTTETSCKFFGTKGQMKKYCKSKRRVTPP